MDGRGRKILKLHWLKRPKTVTENRKLGPENNYSKPHIWNLSFNYSRSTAKNLIHLTNFPGNIFLVCVRKSICTAPFLNAQELHSRGTWKANVNNFLKVTLKVFGERYFSYENNILKISH